MSPHKSKRFTSGLNQEAVYWGNPQSTGAAGRVFDIAIEILVRWEDKTELFLDISGEEARTNAIVIVAQNLEIGGYLYLGCLNDLDSSEQVDPTEVDAFEIRGFEKFPTKDAKNFFRRALL